jgi:hypothetical protein
MIRVALFILLAAAIGRAESAEEMLSSCRPLAKAKVLGEKVAFAQNFQTGTCWAAFGVLQRVSRFVDSNDKPRLSIGCAPANSTRTQLIAIFVDYVQKNPQRLNEDFVDVAMIALETAFPCRFQ